MSYTLRTSANMPLHNFLSSIASNNSCLITKPHFCFVIPSNSLSRLLTVVTCSTCLQLHCCSPFVLVSLIHPKNFNSLIVMINYLEISIILETAVSPVFSNFSELLLVESYFRRFKFLINLTRNKRLSDIHQ